jgi:guanylate kinase
MSNLFIVAAPSGCGKTSLVKALIKKTKNTRGTL